MTATKNKKGTKALIFEMSALRRKLIRQKKYTRMGYICEVMHSLTEIAPTTARLERVATLLDKTKEQQLVTNLCVLLKEDPIESKLLKLHDLFIDEE